MPQLEDHSLKQRDLTLARARADALRLITTRARSVAEVRHLRHRLALRYAPEVVQDVLADLMEHGCPNDFACAEEWQKWREHSSPRGERQVRRELLRLGVDEEAIQQALSEFDAWENAYRGWS